MTEMAHRFPFREYLRLQGAMAAKPPQDDEYDEFILKVWEFFDLRVRAEDYFKVHPYVAKNAQGALPLPWCEIKSAFEKSGPPETVLTLIAKRHYGTIDAIVGNIRKVLARERSKVPIGRVQQVDSHCLRWLTRQPGYSPIEKAGARQEILGVVRRENFDTLENRVLKDFLRRCLALSSVYLRKNDKVEWGKEATIIAVSRLKALCIGALERPEFEKVKDISSLPQPNYVLQQDRLYSRIWDEYLKILREEDVAERLWNRNDEVADLYNKLHGKISLQCSPCAKYDTPIWFNQLDGHNSIVENPIWDNELLATPVEEAEVVKDDVIIIDLTFPWDNRNVLLFPDNHPNAQPFIQNPHRPSLEPGKKVYLEEILANRDADALVSYFHHLHGILGGKKWVVLVPDHWDAAWLERIICARPPALFARSDMFLLWRSVAAALGYQIKQRELSNGESLLVEDGYCHDKYNAIAIRFMDDGNGRVVPQRASLRLHGEDATGGDVRFIVARDKGDRVGLAKLNRPNSFGWRFGCLCGNDSLLVDGARECLRRMSLNETPYFDELDALSLVVVDHNEEVVFKELVAHEECWPGGKKCEMVQSAGTLHRGTKELLLYLAEGETRADLPLKKWNVEFGVATKDDAEIMCQVEITPGQGLAVASFVAPFLERPKLADIGLAIPSDMTKIRIERELKRHFPPTMPYVESCQTLWEDGTPQKPKGIVRTAMEYVNCYLSTGEIPDAGAFALAQPYWGDVGEDKFRRFGTPRFFNEAENSPVDKFKRENVFGNDKKHRLPIAAPQLWPQLFTRLMDDYRRGCRVIRLIAWTYQFDSKYFEEIRDELYQRYVLNNGKLKPEEITFCSNNFSEDDNRAEEIMAEVLTRITNHNYDIDELRLAYNLMQFNKKVLRNVNSALCLDAMNALLQDFNEELFFEQTLFGRKLKLHRLKGAVIASGYLRCMLFMLHKRRYDPKFFVHKSEWLPTGLLAKPLTFISNNQEKTRRSLIEYINGRGTLEGIPMN